MTSSFGWLDHSEQQRRQMLEIVDLFREKGTLDELGVGQIRDTFANHLFPGMSTLHTRARYLLFIPWIFQRLERKRIPSARFDEWARWEQSQLVKSLISGGEREGVIGIAARADIQRPPSVIYWHAMRTLGILRFPYSYDAYVRSVDQHYRDDRGALRSDDGGLVESGHQTWHDGLPSPPDDLAERATFELTGTEADYLREQVLTRQPGTLLAETLIAESPSVGVEHPWDHPAVEHLEPELRRVVALAERFSLVTQGAYLLYNVMLAQAAAATIGGADPEAPERYRERFDRWSDEMTAAGAVFADSDPTDLWDALAMFARPIPVKTRHFVDAWWRFAVGDRRGLVDDPGARRLIRDRETQLKRSLARLQNRRSLENWGGESSTGRLTFRWPNARQLITDIRAGVSPAASVHA